MEVRNVAWNESEPLGGANQPARVSWITQARGPAAVVAVLIAVLVLYAPTVKSMVAIWATSSTFTHGFLVFPACAWFIWTRRRALAETPPTPFWPALLVTAAAGLPWVLGELSASLSITQFALVTIMISVVVAVFGLAWARSLAFPLGFLFFAVPFGDAFVPVLMDWTADFTVVALRLSGVPVLREGNDFTIPSGRWSVVEACSGARYLLAFLVAGTLYAWVMYRSTWRRVAFIAVSLLAPIVANWLRAYMIVMLGHLSDNALAVGVDHLIYGWIFFGIITFLLFTAGARWREDGPQEAVGTTSPERTSRWSMRRLAPALAGAMAVVVVWPVLAARLGAAGDTRQVVPEAVRPAAGWAVAEQTGPWQPALEGPRALATQSFARAQDRVDLFAAFYRNQRQGSELVSSQNRLADDTNANGWRPVARETRTVALERRNAVVRSAVLRSREGRYVLVWHWYWLAPAWSDSDVHAKIDLALDRLLLRTDTSAWMAVATAHDPEVPEQAERVLRGFLVDMAASVDAALTVTSQR